MPLVNDVYLQITEPAPGPDETGSARQQTVVLLHGLGSNGTFWTPLVPYLSTRYRVVQVDAPGFGRSNPLPANRGYDLQDATHKIADALSASGIHQYALIGHSFGGGLAALYALEHPERVSALGLLAPAGFMKSPGSVRLSWVFGPLGWASRFISKAGIIALRNSRVRGTLFGPYVHAVDSFTYGEARSLAQASAQAVEGGAAGVAIVKLGLLSRAGGIGVPTFIGWGINDRIVDSRLAAQLGEQIAGAEVVLYPNAGHALLYEPHVLGPLGQDLNRFLEIAFAAV
jgi:pimeloyl-ACP methyl ester carboxylesterase